ncbi:hypothetical protein CerSpe_113500 [Prunus speciosa]
MSSSSLPNPMRLLKDEDGSLSRIYDGDYHKNPYDLNSKIMLTAIISLSVVVLLVIVLHTYARCVLRRQALRRATMRHHLGSTMAHVHLSEQPKTGLEPSIIAALPTFVFTRVDGQDDGRDNAIEHVAEFPHYLPYLPDRGTAASPAGATGGSRGR